MAYIRNCETCGKRISLREMPGGQWVAFDINTQKPHKHRKKPKNSRGKPIMPPQNSGGKTIMPPNTPAEPKQNAGWGGWIFGAIVVGILVLIFSE